MNAGPLRVLADLPPTQMRQRVGIGVPDLEAGALTVAGAAIHALLLHDLHGITAVVPGRPDGGHRADGDDLGQLAGADAFVIGLRRMVMLQDDGDVGMGAAVDLTAGGGYLQPLRQVGSTELLDEQCP